MKLVEVPSSRQDMLQDFCNKSCMTWVGIDLDFKNPIRLRVQKKMLEKALRDCGMPAEQECIGYWFKGGLMNTTYGLTKRNAYSEETIFLVIPGFYNSMFKEQVGARWFDDIVASNCIKENAQRTNSEPDFK